MKYTIKQFNHQFPDEKACLEFIYKRCFPNGGKCKQCTRSGCFYPVSGRRSYACSWCGYQIYPTAHTIFHKSRTSLKSWFFAMFLMSQSKNGVSAKEIERHVGVTYKTAFRMMKKIRTLMMQKPSMLSGTVEVDETLIGGVTKNKGKGRHLENKTIIIGAVERKGQIRTTTIKDNKTSSVMPLVRSMVKLGSNLMTDEHGGYLGAKRAGYNHQSVKHRANEYVRGNVHTNTIEGFWSQLKRSIHGTYHAVSPKYLQDYVDEFSYRYNHRFSSVPLFELLIRQMAA